MEQPKRTFIPGSEWLYYKIYAGNRTIENILTNEIYLIVKEVNKLDLIDKWFFIRYADPDPHIRLRFSIKSSRSIEKILAIMYKQFDKLIDSNIVWKIQIDTYVREIERYTKSFIEISESIFYWDSECMLDVLKYINAFNSENYRWMIAIKMIDSMLSDFSFSLENKCLLLSQMSESFKSEFSFNRNNSKQLNLKYRNNRHHIEMILSNTVEDEKLNTLMRLIDQRTDNIQRSIDRSIYNEFSSSKLKSLLTSYIHMNLNRLFISSARTHELVLYDFLQRYYTSKIAKIKYSIINK